jgi:hypothetical protein
MWTVYEKPSDYPHCFVARKFLVDGEITPTDEIIVSRDLAPIQRQLERGGFVRLARDLYDEPQIVEVWV